MRPVMTAPQPWSAQQFVSNRAEWCINTWKPITKSTLLEISTVYFSLRPLDTIQWPFDWKKWHDWWQGIVWPTDLWGAQRGQFSVWYYSHRIIIQVLGSMPYLSILPIYSASGQKSETIRCDPVDFWPNSKIRFTKTWEQTQQQFPV